MTSSWPSGSARRLAVSLAACGGGASSAGGEAGDGGKVVIGVKFDQPGLGLKEGNDNTGFDVEVARYVAKELGYTEVEFKESPSAQRETLLQSDQVKMIFATYSITDDRKQKVSFGGPYFIAGQDLLVKADNTDITGPDSPERQEALLGDRLDLGQEGQGQLRQHACSCRSTTPTPSAWRR